MDVDGEGSVYVNNKPPVLETTNVKEAGKQLHNNLADAVKSMELCDMIFENAINR